MTIGTWRITKETPKGAKWFMQEQQSETYIQRVEQSRLPKDKKYFVMYKRIGQKGWSDIQPYDTKALAEYYAFKFRKNNKY